MDSKTRVGSDIHSHGTMASAGVIRPIENWSTEDVWEYLLDSEWLNGNPNPFHEVNQKTGPPVQGRSQWRVPSDS